MKKIMEVKNSLSEVGANMKDKLQMNVLKVENKLKEKKGSLLEYLEESVIGVVLLGLIIAGLVLIISNTVFPQLEESIKSAFTAGAK